MLKSLRFRPLGVLATVGTLAALAVTMIAAAPGSATTPAEEGTHVTFSNWKLKGTLNDSKLNQIITLPSGCTFNGKATIPGALEGETYCPTFTVTMNVFGLLPVKLGLSMTESEKVKGTITSGTTSGDLLFKAMSKDNIALSSVNLLGLTIPMGCTTSQPVVFPLESEAPPTEMFSSGSSASFSGETTLPSISCHGGFVGALFGNVMTGLMSGPNNSFTLALAPPTTTTTSTTKTSSTTTPTTTTTATTTTTTATTTTSSSLSTPAVTLTEIPGTGGEHGYPYDAVPPPSGVPGAPPLNTETFKAAGYVEKEFAMSGDTNVYRESSPWSSNGEWGISVSQSNVPYTTRLLVRYPTNPAKFNGTVIFEWSNVTTGGDQDPVWAELGEEAVRQGYAFVTVSAQKAGLEDLVRWDPKRYTGLGDSNDGQSYSIFTQAAEAVKHGSAILLGGLTPKELIGTGDSQSAFRIDTYVNAFQPVTHAFNGFIAVGRAVTAAPLGNGLISLSPFPADIRTNNTAPFIQLNTQGDIVELDAGAARQADNTDLRTWELPGASHIDAHEAAYEVETIAREEPTVPVPQCIYGTPIEETGTALDGVNQTNNMSLYVVEDAALMNMQKWLVNGVAAPHEPSQISTTPILFGLYDLVNSNQYGVGNGGIRLPEAEVPTEEYSALNFSKPSQESFSPQTIYEELKGALEAAETGSISNAELRSAGLCLLSGYFNNLPSSTLESLYPTPADYASKFKTEAERVEAEGFMTPGDAANVIAVAEAGFGPLQQPFVSIP